MSKVNWWAVVQFLWSLVSNWFTKGAAKYAAVAAVAGSIAFVGYSAGHPGLRLYGAAPGDSLFLGLSMADLVAAIGPLLLVAFGIYKDGGTWKDVIVGILKAAAERFLVKPEVKKPVDGVQS